MLYIRDGAGGEGGRRHDGHYPLVRGPTRRSNATDPRVLFGGQLRNARRLARLSQADVAARVGSRQSSVSKVENGTENPTLSTCAEYARAVGCTFSTVLFPPGDVSISGGVDPELVDSVIEMLVSTQEQVAGIIASLRAAREKPSS